MENQELLQAIRQIIKEENKPIEHHLQQIDQRLDRVEEHLGVIDEHLEVIDGRLENLEEDSKITRSSVNLLLGWAEDVSVMVKVPLLKKAE